MEELKLPEMKDFKKKGTSVIMNPFSPKNDSLNASGLVLDRLHSEQISHYVGQSLANEVHNLNQSKILKQKAITELERLSPKRHLNSSFKRKVDRKKAGSKIIDIIDLINSRLYVETFDHLNAYLQSTNRKIEK